MDFLAQEFELEEYFAVPKNLKRKKLKLVKGYDSPVGFAYTNRNIKFEKLMKLTCIPVLF